MTDSLQPENLQFLSQIYSYYFMEEIQDTDTIIFKKGELKSLVDKVIEEITNKTRTLRIYFNNHYCANQFVQKFLHFFRQQ